MTTTPTSQRLFFWGFLRRVGKCVLMLYFLYIMANLTDIFQTIRYFSALSHYDETTNMEPASIELYSIDNQQKRHSVFLTIPKAYLDHKQDWKGGPLTDIHIKTEWHAMQPWTIASKANPAYNYRDGLFIYLSQAHANKISTKKLVDMRTSFLVDKGMTKEGYRYYTPKDIPGNNRVIRGSDISEIFVPTDNNDSEARLINCVSFHLGKTVGCRVSLYTKKIPAFIQYTFARDQFEHWREIDRNVLNFLMSLKTQDNSITR